jgi:hypothetical protein
MSRLSYAGVIRVRFNGFTENSISAQRLPEARQILGANGISARETYSPVAINPIALYLHSRRRKMPHDLTEELVDKLRTQVESKMTGLKITDFKVNSDYDHDGDPILRFQIVYDETGEDPDAARVSALVRHIRRWLDEKLPETFPVFRFVTVRDLADETV